jgi:hypothetical protein
VLFVIAIIIASSFNSVTILFIILAFIVTVSRYSKLFQVFLFVDILLIFVTTNASFFIPFVFIIIRVSRNSKLPQIFLLIDIAFVRAILEIVYRCAFITCFAFVIVIAFIKLLR